MKYYNLASKIGELCSGIACSILAAVSTGLRVQQLLPDSHCFRAREVQGRRFSQDLLCKIWKWYETIGSIAMSGQCYICAYYCWDVMVIGPCYVHMMSWSRIWCIKLSARWCQNQASSSGKQDELRRALRRMVLAADAHVADLFSCGRGQELEKGQGAAGGCNGILILMMV